MSTARDRTREAQGKSSNGITALNVTVNGVTHVIDARTFTIRENYARKRVLQDNDLPTDDNLLTAAASVWVVLRREDPDVTLDSVLDAMTVGDWLDATSVEDDENPSS